MSSKQREVSVMLAQHLRPVKEMHMSLFQGLGSRHSFKHVIVTAIYEKEDKKENYDNVAYLFFLQQ